MQVDITKDVDRRLALQFYGGVQFNDSRLEVKDVVTRFREYVKGKGKEVVSPASTSSLQLEPVKTM